MRVVACLLLAAAESPITRVVGLLTELRTRLTTDGQQESVVYDEFACWCERTTSRKAEAIENSQALIESLGQSVMELKGRLGSTAAEVAKLEKDIASAGQSTKKAEALRSKEHEDFVKDKTSLEQGIANLDKAMQVLSEGTTGFTAAMMETKMLTVAAGVRSAMSVYGKHNDDMAVKKEQFDSVKSFLGTPAAELVEQRASSPHKQTYSTQSSAIQGILSDMSDTFKRNLASIIEEESTKKSDYDALMATRAHDSELLKTSLTSKKLSQGNDDKQLAEDTKEREETEKQLDTDSKFFETTKESCKMKADEWAVRTQLRAEELNGINQAIDILSSDDANATFATAHNTSFLQLTSYAPEKMKAYNALKKVAVAANSPRIAAIASQVYTSTTGHFDVVIVSVDKMIEHLREEEKADIAHKDFCDKERYRANGKNEQLEYDMEQLANKNARLSSKIAEKRTEINATESEMRDLATEMKNALAGRNEENAAFQAAMKADVDAVKIIADAIDSLSKFYSFAQVPAKVEKAVQASVQPSDTAPKTFEGSYGGRSSEGTGLVSILAMLKEDLQKEIKTAKLEERASEAAYRKLLSESRAADKAMKEKVTSLNANIAEKNMDIKETQADSDDKNATKEATDEYLDEIKPDCDWIDSKFGDRKMARQDEIDGLTNAKASLAGMQKDMEATAAAGLLAKSARAKSAREEATVDDELDALDATERSFGISFLQRKA
jgi:predicted  nucleic acid-binding Zn-ribbon protein